MGHLHHHYLSDISTLRTLFNADTPLFLILKELVQNADDSGARQMFLGYSPGLVNTDHPLLAAPALFASNDGPFEPEHALAITRFGLSSKGTNSSTVGKFGLGLKSVFAIAEAFVYLDGTRDSSECWSPPHFDVINPWYDENVSEAHHASWDTLTLRDRAAILSQLSVLGVPAGFHVWIPLRRDIDCRSERTKQPMYIINRPLGDQGVSFSRALQHELAGLLPLLKSVEHLTLISPDGQVTLSRHGAHRYADLQHMPSGTRPLVGKVTIRPGSETMRYSGQEVMLDRASVQPFRESPFWPRTNVISLTETTQEPDPSLGHGAAVWEHVESVSESGVFKIQWAVFLPLAVEEEIELNVPVDFTLTLHGYFFLKSDRKTLYAWPTATLDHAPPQDEEALRAQWNALVSTQATLPQVLPSLAALAATLTESAVREVTTAIKKSKLFQQHREVLCSSHQWVRRLLLGEQRWELVSAQDELLFTPYRKNMVQVFPGFEALFQERVVVNQGFSALSLPECEYHAWPADVLAELLETCPAEQFVASPDWQKTFMAIWMDIGGQAGTDDLMRFVRRLLRQPQWAKWRDQPELLRLLLGKVPEERRLVLPEGLDTGLESSLLSADTELLIIPQGFVKTIVPPQISWSDQLQLAACLEGQRGTAAMLKLLRADPAHRARVDLFLQNRPLFRVKALGNEETGPASPADVVRWHEAGQAFLDVGEVDGLEALQRALDGQTFYLIEGDVARALGMTLPTPESDLTTTVLQAQRLAPLDERLPLIHWLHKSVGLDSPEVAAAVRVLLHGQVGGDDLGRPLLIQGSVDETTGELWKAALAFAEQRQDGWRVLQSDVNLFSPQEKRLLGVEVLNVRTFQDFIRDAPAAVDGGRLGQEVVYGLMSQLTDQHLLKQMRLFRSTTGRWVSINQRTYRHGKFELDAFLKEQVILVQLPRGKGAADKAAEQKIIELAPEFTPAVAWELVAGSDDPSAHWKTALHALKLMSGFLPETIKSRAWLPLKRQGAVAPRQLLSLEPIDEQLAQLRDSVGSTDVCWDDLAPEVHTHPLADALRKALPEQDQVLQRVGELLSHAEDYFIGRIGGLTATWLEHFRDLPSSPFKLTALLSGLQQAGVEDEVLQNLVRGAQQGLPADRAAEALKWIQVKLQEPRHRRQADLHALFHCYLKELRDSGERDDYLPELWLLNRMGEWTAATALVREGDNFAERSVLDRQQREALYTKQELAEQFGDTENLDEEVSGTRNLLKQLVSEMAPHLPQPDYLGAFLALLDGDKQLHKDAQFYLQKNVNDFRRQALDGVFTSNGRTALLDRLAESRIDIAEILGDRASVPNLIGHPVEVVFKDDAELNSLLVYTSDQRPYWTNRDHLYHFPCSLKRVDFSQPDLDLPTLLLNTVRDALRRVTGGDLPPRLDEAWQGLAQGSQVQIHATQLTILRRAIGQWGQQLGLAKNSEVRRLLDRIATLEGREDVAIVDRNPQAQREVAEKAAELRTQLKRVVEQDEVAQQALLSGVRKKISEQQYEVASVLFELTQNADDALSEWREMGGDLGPQRQAVVIELKDRVLRFAHWGRPINCYRHGTFDARQEARQYDQDLVKMLTLLASGKTQESRVTGYFGLGFKSVFLVSDHPSIVSDRLVFNIVGGVYPTLPPQEDIEDLRRTLEDLTSGDLSGGTLIELPLRDEAHPQAVLQRFQLLVPYLLAFSREIRTLTFRIEGQPDIQHHWKPIVVRPGVEVGELLLDGKLSQVLVLSGPDVRLMLALDRSGIRAFHQDLPNLWVTVPTKEQASTGFIVNGMFPLDPGRATLARNTDEVLERATQWAEQLSMAVESLFTSSQDWADFQSKLRLGRDTTPYEFWSSFWQVLTSQLQINQNPVKDLFVHLLWRATHSLRSNYVRHALLPTGLTGDYRQLVPWQQTLQPLHADLAAPEVFDQVSQWRTFQKRYPAGSVIHPTTASTLARLAFPPLQGSVVTLVDALRDLVKGDAVTPAVAETLAPLLTAEFTQQLRATDHGKAWLESLTFMSVDGLQRSPKLLLSADAKSESAEASLVAFAPAHARLHSDYGSADALSLFRLLRNSLNVPDKTVAEWLLQASEDRQSAALKHLLGLGLTDPVIHLVVKEAKGTWLTPDALVKNVHFQELSLQYQGFIASLLDFPQPELPWGASFDAPDEEYDERPEPQEKFDERSILERIYAWWTDQRLTYTSALDERMYPSGQPFVTESPFDDDDQELRERWQALFLLSSLQTMGQVKPEQHRTFLQLCQKRGWLKIFSQSSAPDSTWMGIVREFLQDQATRIEYYHWMRQFVPFYQLSRWLKAYADNFTEADKYRESIPLDQLLTPRNNPRLQGTDIDAPPLKEALGIGGNFLVRELLRHGALTNPNLHPLAYVPRKRVRALIETLGGFNLSKDHGDASSEIYTYLAQYLGKDRATFHGDFDLPLYILAGPDNGDAEAEALQRTILGGVLRVSESQQIDRPESESGEWRTLWDGRRVPIRS